MTNLYKKLAMVFTTIALFTFVATSQTTVSYKIIDAMDDLEERLAAGADALGSTDLASSDLELGTETAPEPQLVGMIFRGVAVPVGATITNAYVQFQCDEADANVITLTIVGGKEANVVAPFPATDFSISSHPKTTATVSWTPPEWFVPDRGAAQKTPDIKTIVQEIIGLSGWSSGNNMLIMVSYSDPAKAHRTAEAFEGDPAGVAELFITYTVGTAVENPSSNVVSSLIYPNPSNGMVNIKNPSTGKFGFSIYSIDGKMVASKQDISGSTTEVDMTSKPRGTYFVNVKAGERTLKNKLILK